MPCAVAKRCTSSLTDCSGVAAWAAVIDWQASAPAMHNMLLQRRDRTEIMRLLVKLVNADSGVTVTVDDSNPRYRFLLKTDACDCWVTVL